MKKYLLALFVIVVTICSMFMVSCGGEDEGSEDDLPEGDFIALLTNQIDEVIIPTIENYNVSLDTLSSVVTRFTSSIDEANLVDLRDAYQESYIAYQAAAVHNYKGNKDYALVLTSNLYPLDTSVLSSLIDNKSYSFNGSAQRKANGFPALDYMLYGPDDVVTYFSEDTLRVDFLKELVVHMTAKSASILNEWEDDRVGFINNGGTGLNSSVSTQLNEIVLYYEDYIRGGKVGFPIGKDGPNDTQLSGDSTIIEAYYQSEYEGDESFTFDLLKASIEEVEDFYLGSTSDGSDGQGYDDLLIARGNSDIDTDIKAQFASIYSKIASRNSISGDKTLYDEVQGLVTIFKSDLFTVLNVQDSDNMTDGD